MAADGVKHAVVLLFVALVSFSFCVDAAWQQRRSPFDQPAIRSSAPSLSLSSSSFYSSRQGIRDGVNCSLAKKCTDCTERPDCVWCGSDGCVSAGQCSQDTRPCDDNDDGVDHNSKWKMVLGSAVLGVCGVLVTVVWFWLYRREAALLGGQRETRSKTLPPDVHHDDAHSGDSDGDASSLVYSELLLDDPEAEEGASESHQALFIGSVVNRDAWHRTLHRALLLPTVLLGCTVVVLFATVVAVLVEGGGGAGYWLWVAVVVVLWLLLPAYPMISLFYSAYARRVHSYLFYNGKLVLWRANGVMTEYPLDHTVTHHSDTDRLCGLVPVALTFTRITTYSHRWPAPLLVYIANHDKSIFLRFLTYATAEDQTPSGYVSFREQQQQHSDSEASGSKTLDDKQKSKDWLDDDDDDDGPLVIAEASKERDWLDED